MQSSRLCEVCPNTAFSDDAKTVSKVLDIDRWLLRTLLRGIGSPNIGAALWDGENVVSQSSTPYRMVIHSRTSLLRLIINPLLYFGDDYSAGNIKIEGGLVPFLETVYRAMERPGVVRNRYKRVSSWYRRELNSLTGSRKSIHHHYDIGNEFYRFWLDDEMLYTCAYFTEPEISLEAAQDAKMDLICRKLQLKGGERVVEAGCGWG